MGRDYRFVINIILPDRKMEIQGILADLESLQSDAKYGEAAKLNSEFFRAIRSPLTYVRWLLFKAPKLRRNRSQIVEIGDLPLERWQKSGLEVLSGFEAIAGASLPIKQRIMEQIENSTDTSGRPILMLSLGCGGMELEREVIYELVRRHSSVSVAFVGVDYAPVVPEIVTSRLRPLTAKGLLRLEIASRVDIDDLQRLKSAADSPRFQAFILNTDLFQLAGLPEDFFDLAYHTRLAHHLTAEGNDRLRRLALRLAPKLIEFDDLFSIRTILSASRAAWRFPAGFAGCIFSYLRDHSRKELLSQCSDGAKLKTVYTKPVRCYIREYDKH
jgi:hypothetical protein